MKNAAYRLLHVVVSLKKIKCLVDKVTNKYLKKAYLAPGEVAELLNVSTETVRAWCRKGYLTSYTTFGGHRRFKTEEVLQIANQFHSNVDCKMKQNLKMLIVSSDEQLIQFMGGALDSFTGDFFYEFATEGFEAGLQLVEFKPDIVFLDMETLNLDAKKLCRCIKSSGCFNGMRIVAITTKYCDAAEEKQLIARVDAILQKPVDRDVLRKFITG